MVTATETNNLEGRERGGEKERERGGREEGEGTRRGEKGRKNGGAEEVTRITARNNSHFSFFVLTSSAILKISWSL